MRLSKLFSSTVLRLKKIKERGISSFKTPHVPDFCQVTNVTIRFRGCSPAQRKPGFLGPINTTPLLEALHSLLPTH